MKNIGAMTAKPFMFLQVTLKGHQNLDQLLLYKNKLDACYTVTAQQENFVKHQNHLLSFNHTITLSDSQAFCCVFMVVCA